jgi:hypothetical protein
MMPTKRTHHRHHDISSTRKSKMTRVPTSKGPLVLYTVYDHPKDFPDEYVIRRWDAYTYTPIDKEQPFARALTLDDIHAALPPAVYNLGRLEEDDPVIIEVWV